MSVSLRITMLGTPAILGKGVPLGINRFQFRAIIYYLAAQAEPTPRARLGELLWPDIADAPARRHLTQLLSHLRRLLPESVLLTPSPSHVQLDWDRVWSDVVVFKQQVNPPSRRAGSTLQETIDLYRGPFLEGIAASGLPEYELWIDEERQWLEERYCHLLDVRARELMAEDAVGPAIELLQRRLAVDDLAEGAHRFLIAGYSANGDRAAAMRHYQRYAALLQERLHVTPTAETVMLYEAVRDGAAWPEIQSLLLPHREEKTVNVPATAMAAPRAPAACSNLPHEPLPIIGRADELAALAALLADEQKRLLTIVGMGGMGKTRLALAAAEEQQRVLRFPDGIYFVSLASLTEPAEIVPTILRTLRISLETGPSLRRTLLAQLLDFLRGKRLLLLLDNFEHLLPGAGIVTQILHAALGVRLLVTSRKALEVHGEQLLPVRELPYPASEAVVDRTATAQPGADAASYPAVQLFVQSARRRAPSFVLTEENQADVVRICRLVGGMPLALELAASWITTLSAAEIGVEIAHSLDFLEAEIQDVPARHQNIRALLNAILEQLSAVDQAVFSRLAVFQGGFTRQAAYDIAGASLGTLRSLASNQLIRYDAAAGRYLSHDLLRIHAARLLSAQPGIHTEIRERHSRYYCVLVAHLAPELKGAQQQSAFAELAAEQANLQQAWSWAVGELRLDLLEQSVTGLGQFYSWMGNQSDGERVFRLLVRRFDEGEPSAPIRDPGRMARLLAESTAWQAHFSLAAGQLAQAEAQLQRSFTLVAEAAAQGVDSRRVRALTLLHWGHLMRPGNLTAAIQAYTQSRNIYADLDLAWEHALATSWLGETYHLVGEQQAAIELLTQAHRAFEPLADQRSVARVLAALADCYLLDRADLDAAVDTAKASLRLWRSSDDQLGIADTAVILAYAHCWRNQPACAEPLLDEALAIYRHHGHRYGECHVYYVMMVVANYRGDMAQKEEIGERGLALAHELGDAKLIGDFSRGLANVYLARHDYEKAHALHVEAMAAHESAGVQTYLPWLHLVRAYSGWKIGNGGEAHEHLVYALRISADHRDHYTAVHALFFVAQILWVQGLPARAMELKALAQREYIWQGSLSGDRIFVDPLRNLDDALSAREAAEARERGTALDLFATVAQLALDLENSSL